MPEGISETAIDIEDIATAAAGIFDTDSEEDSEDLEIEDEADEVAEEDVEDDDDLDLEDDDVDSDEEDDEDDLDEDDEDSEDDESEDDEDDESEDDEDEDSEEKKDQPELHTVKVQGQEFQVPLPELIAGYQRQEDYTLKTQRLSSIYGKMSQWYEERANDPEYWVQEIVSGQDDPAATIAGAIQKTGNATVLLGQTLKHLVSSGEISDELVEALNLKQVAEQAKEQSLHLEVQSLKQQIQDQSQQSQQAAEYQQVEQVIQQQWLETADRYGLDPADQDTFLKTLQFAHSAGIPHVGHAYAALTSQAGGTPAAPQDPKRKKAQSAVKKRKTAVMSRKPAGGSARKTSTRKPSADPVDDAASAALAELGLAE